MKYVIWSFEHMRWWGPNFRGYVERIEDAGRYSLEEAAGPCLRDVEHNEIPIMEPNALRNGPPTYHPYKGLMK